MTVWWHPKAVLAADFYNGRYGLFARETVLTGVEGTVRASEHRILDAAGAWQTVTNDVLARQDSIGAYIGGALTNGFAKPDDFTNDGVNWITNAGVSTSGDFNVLTDSSSSVTQQARGDAAIAANTSLYTLWVDAKKDAENTIIRSIFFRLFGGTVVSRQVNLNTSTGAYVALAGSGTVSVYDLGDRWRVVCALTNNGTNSVANIYLNPCFNTSISAPGASIDSTLTGSASFSWPHVILGKYPGHIVRIKGTRQASVVTAPASGGAPFAGFTESGLAAALSARVKFQLTHVGDGIMRPLLDISDGTVNNRLRLYIDTDDKPGAAVVSGGVTLATVKLASALTAGRAVLAVNFDPAGGLYLVRLTGLEEASASLSAMPSGLSTMRYGSSPTPNYLNDLLEEVQVAQALSQAAAKTWVQGIATGSLATVLDPATLAGSGAARASASLAAALDGASLAGAAAAGIGGRVAAIMEDALLGASASASAEASLDAALDDTSLDAEGRRGATASQRLEMAATRPGALTLTGVRSAALALAGKTKA